MNDNDIDTLLINSKWKYSINSSELTINSLDNNKSKTINLHDLSMIEHKSMYKFRFYGFTWSSEMHSYLSFKDHKEEELVIFDLLKAKKKDLPKLLAELRNLEINMDENTTASAEQLSISPFTIGYLKTVIKSMWLWFLFFSLILLAVAWYALTPS